MPCLKNITIPFRNKMFTYIGEKQGQKKKAKNPNIPTPLFFTLFFRFAAKRHPLRYIFNGTII